MPEVTESEREGISWLREFFRSRQCDDCKAGRLCKCTRADAQAYLENLETGERKYFCYVGCAMLQLDDEDFKHFSVSQFDNEGHYEKLARG